VTSESLGADSAVRCSARLPLNHVTAPPGAPRTGSSPSWRARGCGLENRGIGVRSRPQVSV